MTRAGGSLHHDLHPVAGVDTVARGDAVENWKTCDCTVWRCHPARQSFDRFPGLDGDDLEMHGLRSLAFRQCHAAESPDRFAEGAIDLRGRAFRGKDETIDVGSESHRIEPKYPLVAFGGCGRSLQPVDAGVLDGLGVDILDPAGVEGLGRRLL